MSLTEIKSKNLIKFYVRDKLHYHALIGDNIINAFDRGLMDIYLEQFHDTLNCNISYDDIIFISVTTNHTIHMNTFPNNLKELYITNSNCITFVIPEITASNIRIISLDYTNLHQVPDISNCQQLTKFTLTHSNVSNFDTILPISLIELNLRWNVLTNKTFDFTKIASLQKLDVNNNYFTTHNLPQENQSKYSFLQQNTYIHKIITNAANIDDIRVDHYPYNVNIRRRRDPDPPIPNISPPIRNIFDTSQTVHLSSVTISVAKSLCIIKEYIKTNNYIVHDVTLKQIKKYIKNKDILEFLETNFKIKIVHTVTESTYKNLFNLIWCVAINHIDKLLVIDRIAIEITDSISYCFTGKINRLVNSLTGFLDDVHIGISNNEQLQLYFQQIIRRINNKTLDYIDGLCEINDIFKDETPEFKHPWLLAYKDYEPDHTIIRCKTIQDDKTTFENHLLTYDNMIIQNNCVIGSYETESRECIFFHDEPNANIICKIQSISDLTGNTMEITPENASNQENASQVTLENASHNQENASQVTLENASHNQENASQVTLENASKINPPEIKNNIRPNVFSGIKKRIVQFFDNCTFF